MSKLFMGKFAFKSINSGQQSYLTSQIVQDGGGQSGDAPLMLAKMLAPALTPQEKLVAYQADNGLLYLQFNNLSYLTVHPTLGWLMGAQDFASAVPFKIGSPEQLSAAEAAGQTDTVVWQRLNSQTQQWETMQYDVDTDSGFLTFPPQASAGNLRGGITVYTKIEQISLTPGLPYILSTKNGQNLDLTNIDFSGNDLGVDFTGADFRGANLVGTNFSGATLDKAIFEGNDLTQVIWGKGLRATGACFRGAVGRKVIIGSDETGDAKADLTGADFTGADFSHADFTNAILQGAFLYSANFCRANLSGADLSGVHCERSATGATGANLSFAILVNAKMSEAVFEGADLSYAQLYNSRATPSLDRARLVETNFTGANLQDTDLTQAVIEGVNFNQAILTGCNFSGVNLVPSGDQIPVSLAGAHLGGAQFNQSSLQQVNLANAAISLKNGVALFALPQGSMYAAQLDQSLLPTALQAAFGQTGFPLPASVTVSPYTAGSQWSLILSPLGNTPGLEYIKYTLLLVDDTLKVYGAKVAVTRLTSTATLETRSFYLAMTQLAEDNLSGDTICPNQADLKTNLSLGFTWEQMLTVTLL